jgi:hypothetical protein
VTQATAPASAGTTSIPAYALRPAEGWQVAGNVTVQPVPSGEHLLTVSVIGPDAEVMQRYGWWVAALACDEFGTFAQYHKPKLYFPGTLIERSRMFYRTEDWFTDSGRRSFTIAARPDWTAEPFSVSAFINTNGTGKLVTCADLPALT